MCSLSAPKKASKSSIRSAQPASNSDMPAPKITRPAQAMADAPLGQAHARHVAIRTKPILFTHPFEDRPDNRGQFGAMRIKRLVELVHPPAQRPGCVLAPLHRQAVVAEQVRKDAAKPAKLRPQSRHTAAEAQVTAHECIDAPLTGHDSLEFPRQMRQFKCRSELGQNIAELESRGHPGRMKVRERVHAFNARHIGISCEQLQTTKRIPLVAFGVRVA